MDRGSFSVECILTIFSFKLLYPNHFFMARGKSDCTVIEIIHYFLKFRVLQLT